jgi:hypothetical protein
MATYETDFEGYTQLTQKPTYRVNYDKGTVINSKAKLLGNLKTDGYTQLTINGRTHNMSRVIFESRHGAIPEGQEIDHVNSNRSDNSISNLQACTRSENRRRAATNRDYSFVATNHTNRRSVIATNLNLETREFQSLYAAGKATGINPGIVQMCCKGTNNSKGGISKNDGVYWRFEYI